MARARGRGTGIVLLALAALALLLWLLQWDPGGDRSHEVSIVSRTPVSTASTDAGARPKPALPARSPALAPTPRCDPRAEQRCYAGAVWWFDSCGVASELVETCSTGECRGGHCEPSARTNDCATLSPYGVCDGAVAKACVAGQQLAIDCSSDGARCVMTSEGAICKPRDPTHDCDAAERARCSDDRVRQCVDGSWSELDCRLRGGHCSLTPEGARCSSELPPLPAAEVPELCDGVDNDHDGRIDESSICAGVSLVAFVPEGAKLVELDSRMAAELEIVNRVLAPLKFRWAKTVKVGRELRNFDPRTLETVAAQLALQESRAARTRERASSGSAINASEEGLDFYVPVLFSESLRMRPPKAGISTLPNSRCGGVRVADAPAPASGLIVVSEARQPETLTHELGHYLGLCHTHEELARFAVRLSAGEPCHNHGDGICDTPEDPGPTQCQLLEGCSVSCTRQPTQPEAANIMSYYVPCRRALTPEQLAEVQRNLALRRAWFGCLDPRDCACQPGQGTLCPNEMSCHPNSNGAPGFSCELDGPGVPGAACQDSSQCGDNALCMRSDANSRGVARCVRACRSAPDCTCGEVGLGFRVCRQDLER